MSASPLPVLGLAALIGGVAFSELAQFGGSGSRPFPIFACALLLLGGGYGIFAPSGLLLSILLALTVLGVAFAPGWVRTKARMSLELSSLWCVAPLVSLAVLQALYAPANGFWAPASPLLLVIVPLWVGDSLAYFVGKSIGKHLLAPKISPKKTIEGALANVAGCVGAAVAIGTLISVPLWIAATCGVLAGVLGQLGDLFESGLKRSSGLKDAGSLLPGHGGVLDRIDSLLFAVPAQALFLALAWPPHLR
jgi:phosphatidate cytidylyltransferase